MDESHTPSVIAVDGGGTRCRVAASDGRTIVSVETGSANVSTDFDGGVREIREGLEKLGERLGMKGGALTTRPAFVGLAGVTGPAIAARLRTVLPFQDVRIADDRPAALRGALGERDGVLAHCGTGSFFAAQLDGETRFAGGWGPVLGDEASAQWIGRTALRVTLDCADGLRAPTGLTARLLDDFDGSAGIVRFAGAADPAGFGALARLVTEAAANGDPVAVHVMRLGSNEIAATLRKLGWRAGIPICLTGGIGPHYGPYLPGDMRAGITAPMGAPLEGAISLAFDLARETVR